MEEIYQKTGISSDYLEKIEDGIIDTLTCKELIEICKTLGDHFIIDFSGNIDENKQKILEKFENIYKEVSRHNVEFILRYLDDILNNLYKNKKISYDEKHVLKLINSIDDQFERWRIIGIIEQYVEDYHKDRPQLCLLKSKK